MATSPEALRDGGPNAVPDRTGLALFICLLVVVASVSWRQKVYFDGGLDPVVVAKAGVIALALLLAIHARLSTRDPHPIGVRSLVFLTAYLVVSTFGGWASGDGLSAAIVATRVAMIGAVAYLCLRAFRTEVALRSLFIAMAVVGAVAVVTGILGLGAATTRLQGGFPPLTPNEIALLCGAPALALIWRNLCHAGRRWDLAWTLLLLAGVVASESRTGLAALVAAICLMLVQARRLRPGVVAAVVAACGGVMYVLLTTNVVSAYFERADQNSVATLNSRTIAWSAALDLPQDAYAWWMGGGLALKRIPVQGQYWTDQGLDSSWVSAWVQGGMICVLLLACWILSAFVASWRTPAPLRMLITGVLLFQMLRSFLESGLIDGTPSFFLFLIMSMLAESGSRETLRQAARAWPPVESVRTARAGRARAAPTVPRPGLRPVPVARPAPTSPGQGTPELPAACRLAP